MAVSSKDTNDFGGQWNEAAEKKRPEKKVKETDDRTEKYKRD